MNCNFSILYSLSIYIQAISKLICIFLCIAQEKRIGMNQNESKSVYFNEKKVKFLKMNQNREKWIRMIQCDGNGKIISRLERI